MKIDILAFIRPWLFPFGVVGVYAICSVLDVQGTGLAINFFLSMCKQLAIPMAIAFLVMAGFNRFFSPAMVGPLLGENSGVKKVFFSAAAGIVSMGPIYAWYPLFNSLREKGASSFAVANFICCRAIKPVLFPVLLGYWGWRDSIIFVVACFFLSIITASIVSLSDGG